MNFERIIPNKKPQDTVVVVAMSGGVDSSTVAAYLSQSGYNVIGITLKLYNSNSIESNSRSCCAGKEIADAKKVADAMKFSHYTMNYEKNFQTAVIDDFVETYSRGKTPIPCVRCNQKVKFQDLLRVSKDIGADALVTGHYARRVVEGDEVQLHTAIDKTKDQSYFLFATTNEQLQYLRFPLGNMNKMQTRELARSLGLSIFDKPESQDICFVNSQSSYREFITNIKPEMEEVGNIVDMHGKVIKQHKGIMNYTVGQRHGLGIAHSEPLYVVKINKQTKEIIVGTKSDLLQKSFVINEMNIISTQNILPKEIKAKVKLRSLQEKVPATIYPANDGSARVELENADYAVSPGQACVLYSDSRVLGGGWIV